MIIRQCQGCHFHRTDCESRKAVLKAVQLFSIDGVKPLILDIECQKRLSLVPPGTRVRLFAHFTEGYPGSCHEPPEPDWYGGFAPFPNQEHFDDEHETFTGTVMLPEKNRIMVWLDEPLPEAFIHKGARRVRVLPNRLVPLDEPREEVCPECGKPARIQRAEDDPYVCCKCSPSQWVEETGA